MKNKALLNKKGRVQIFAEEFSCTVYKFYCMVSF